MPGKGTTETIDPITGLPVQEEEADAPGDALRNGLSGAAQQARVRELAALADFDQAAGKGARDSLAATVTGPEIKTAESYLARLTDQPVLSKGERKSDHEKVESSLTARIEQMRSVESSSPPAGSPASRSCGTTTSPPWSSRSPSSAVC